MYTMTYIIKREGIQMANRLKLSTKLIGGFLLGTLITFTVGIIGLLSVDDLTRNINDVATRQLPSIKTLLIISEAQATIDGSEKALLETWMLNEHRKFHYGQIEAAQLRAVNAIKTYSRLSQTSEETAIWKKFVSSQMNPAIFEVVTIDIQAGKYLFSSSGSKLIFPGYLSVYKEEEEENVLPFLDKGEELDLINLLPSQHFTKPPPRYSDATLVKALEEEGVGRPSTYAPIIQTIIARDYVRREKGYFYPTEIGMIVTELLEEFFPDILNIRFTAEMEEKLDEIEEGKVNWVSLLHEFYGPFKRKLNIAQVSMREVRKETISTDQICEQCGRPMVIKWGKNGKFLSCSGYPECKNAKAITTGVKCPREGCNGELVERKSRKGIFYGCSNYPNCKYTARKLPKVKEG